MGTKTGFGLLAVAAAAGIVTVASGNSTDNHPNESNTETEEHEQYKPIEQAYLNELQSSGDKNLAFETAFEAGDELTEFSFTASQGVGANVGEGRRFTRLPRADLNGENEWSAHLPKRDGGPNATSCIACHNTPLANGAGDIATNAVIDPGHSGDPKMYLERNTLPLFALGVPQRLAEEMSVQLSVTRMKILRQACVDGTAKGTLTAKGVSFGTISATRKTASPCKVAVDASALQGIDQDLVVKAFGWKGNHPSIRSFTRSAAHNELGLQGEELVGDQDGDHDGISRELTVGDMTALTIYMAALERPVTKLELSALGLAKVSSTDYAAIVKGEAVFRTVGCASCHVPEMTLNDPVFNEPSLTPGFYDIRFPSGAKPADLNLAAATAISFNLSQDQPNNRIKLANGDIKKLGALPKAANGGAVARWFTDFKRHDMGVSLADPVSSSGIGANMWLTRSLAGVGSTGPWLHDGRATTLNEAIRAHGGEARRAMQNYSALPPQERDALVEFLENLVIFKNTDEEEEG